MIHSSKAPIRIACLCIVAVALVLDFTSIGVTDSHAQDQQIEGDSARQVADRFLQVLVGNPRPGIAFDRVYNFHLQNRSLDQLIDSLRSESSNEATDTQQRGSRLLVIGLIQLRHGNAADAVTTLQQAESLLPQHATVSYQLGKAWIALRERERAIQALERSIDRKPDRIDATDIYLELGTLYCQSGDPQSAVELWQQLTERFPGDDAVAETVAAALVAEQQFDQALEKYESLASKALAPDIRIGYQIKAAEMRRRLGQTDVYRQELQSMMARLRPGSWLHTDVRTRIERSFLDHRDLEGLKEYYNQYLERTPDDLNAMVRLAQLLSAARQRTQAEQWLTRVIERAPDHVDARLGLVEICVEAGLAEQAAEHLEQLLSRDPHHPDYLLRLGEIRLGDLNQDLMDRRRAAGQAWNRLVDGKPNDAVLLVTVARRMQSIGQSERATELYRMAIRAEPRSPSYREYLGDHLFRTGQQNEAIETWRSIAQGVDRNPETLIRVAEILSANQLRDLALTVWQEVAAEDLSLEQRLKVALVLSSAMEHEQAMAHLDIAASIADDFEAQQSVLRIRIDLLKAAGNLNAEIAKLSVAKPTPQSRRLLALFLAADGQLDAACTAIDTALSLAPKDLTLLTDAAELYQQNGDLRRSASVLKSLSDADVRYRTNHLRRLIQIRQQLGELPLAMHAAEALIAANPAAIDSYILYADLAFSANNNTLGEDMLRRAITVDPREPGPRVALAEKLAERFETLQAIELLWQAIEFEDRLSARISLIHQLASLYSRRGETPELVAAIERLSPDALDHHAKQLLIVNVWVAVKDYQQARTVLQQSLTIFPRDVELLDAAVEAMIQSGDFATAASLQQRFVTEQDTAESRARLTSLELKAGLISPEEATLREIAATQDPKRLMEIISRDASKDPEQSAELARVVLEKHPELWDIKLIRAQWLLLSDREQRADDLTEADRLAEEVVALGLSPSAMAPCVTNRPSNAITAPMLPVVQSWQTRPITTSMSGPFVFLSSVNRINSWPQMAALQLSQIQVLNARRISSRVHNGVKSYSFPLADTYVATMDFGQAIWIARCVQVLATCERAKLEGREQTPEQVIAARFMPSEQAVQDVRSLRESVQMQLLQSALMGVEQAVDPALLWQIAIADPKGDHSLLFDHLSERSVRRHQQNLDSGSELAPLNDIQLDVLLDICMNQLARPLTERREISEIAAEIRFRQWTIAEFRFAGRMPPSDFDPINAILKSGFKLALMEIQAALREGNQLDSDQIVAGLVDAARGDSEQQLLLNVSIDWVLSPRTEAEIEFVGRHRQKLTDAWLAHCSRRSLLNQFRISTAELFNAEHSQIVLETPANPGSAPQYKIFRLHQPVTQRVIDQQSLRNIAALMSDRLDAGVSIAKLRITDVYLEHLSTPLNGAPPHENRLRRLVAAFAIWWGGDPEQSAARIEQLAKEAPDDIDLQLEAARMSIVNGRAHEAFERLDRIKADDDRTRFEINFVRILLAAQAQDEAVMRRASAELFSNPIPSAASEVLMRRLKLYSAGFPPAESLRQSIEQHPLTGAPRDPFASSHTRKREANFAMAESLLESGDLVTAAEIAYSILIQLNAQQRFDQIELYERVMDLAIKTGRVRSLIGESERAFHATPSDNHRKLLADLYLAGGSTQEAIALWESWITSTKMSSRSILVVASQHRSRREFNHATIFYLLAIENDFSNWQSQWNMLVDSASMSTIHDAVYDRLIRVGLENCSLFSLCELIRMPGSVAFSDARRRFTSHVLMTHADVNANLDLVLQSIPDSQRVLFPELVSFMTDTITSDEACHPDSPLWAMRGWNDQGQVNGPLAELIGFLHDHPEVYQAFLRSFPQPGHSDRSPAAPVREFLKSLYDLKSVDTRDAAMKRIAEWFPVSFEDLETSRSVVQLPAGLLWQSGQYLESLGLPEDVLMLRIGLFQAAARQMADPSIVHANVGLPQDQLYFAYSAAGHSDLARRAWLKRLHDYELPRTTGIREHRQLQLAEQTAKNLIRVGYPLDAAAIDRWHLNKPLTFRIAEPYSQGVDYQKRFQSQFQHALASIDSDVACEYLIQLSSDAVAEGVGFEIPLGLVRCEQMTETSNDCLLEFAAREAVKTETGRRAAESLLTLAIRSANSGENPNINFSAQLILTSIVRPDALPVLLETLDQQLSRSKQSASALLRTQVLVMGAIYRSDVSQCAAIFEQTLMRLRKIAEEANEHDLLIGLTKLSRHGSLIRQMESAIDGM